MSILIEKKPLSPQMAKLAMDIISRTNVPVPSCGDVVALCLSLGAIAQGEHVVAVATKAERDE